MHRSQVVHIAPVSGAWRVYHHNDPAELRFDDLGEGLDAASALVPAGAAIRIVIHDAAAAPRTAHDSGYSAAG